jgi:hypothetical protein
MKNTLSIMLALLLVVTWTISAYSMRCTNGLITDDSNKIEVLDACGEPMEKYGEEVKIGETGLNTGDDEKWVYDIGGGVYHIIYFDGFNVRKIEIQQK